jgi:flagellin-like protein
MTANQSGIGPCEDNRGVSEVIGVILVVGITIMLAAVIATTVLSQTDKVQGKETPNTEFDFAEQPSGAHSVSHDGGEELESGAVEIVYTDTTGTTQRETWTSTDGIQPADSMTTSNPVEDGSEIRIVWSADGGERTETLYTYNVPP